jgi:WXG100 family type VII secretion target
MGGYTVTFPDVQTASAALLGAAEAMRTELNLLTGSVEHLLGGGWRGAAAASFGVEWDGWRGAAAGVIDALAALAVSLGAGGDAYRATETAVRMAAS